MERDTLFKYPDKETLNEIKRQLGEDSKKLEKQIKLFREWLESEQHLPNDIDCGLIQTFLRACKLDMEKAKQKFEFFLCRHIGLKKYFDTNGIYDESYFKTATVHREFIIYPELTPNGYRSIYYRFPKSADNFDFDETYRYVFVLLDYLYYEDTAASYQMVADFGSFTVQHLAKFNIRDTAACVDYSVNVSPFMLKVLHIVNAPKVAEIFIRFFLKVFSDKLCERTMQHTNQDDLFEYISKNILSQKYGGNGPSLDDIGDTTAAYFVKNGDWILKTANLDFVGPIPDDKKYLHSFEDSQMDGSFKQLSID